MTEHSTVKAAKPKADDFSQDDLAALAVIKKITNKGDNVEVKRKDGKLTVYHVRKEIAAQ